VSERKARAGGPRSGEAILEGPILATLIGLAWPMLASTLLGQLVDLVSMFWAGRLIGTNAIALVALLGPLFTALMHLITAIPVGVQVLVARSVGKGDGEAPAILVNGAYLVLAVSLVVTVAGLALLGPLSRTLAGDLDLAADLRAYLVPWCLFYPVPGLAMVISYGVAAGGWTRFGLLQTALTLGLVAMLLPLCISGLGFGLAGMAIADGVTDGILLALTWAALRRYREELRLGAWTREAYRAVTGLWRRIVAVGLPPQLARSADFIAQVVFIRIVVGDGETAVAAYGVAMVLFLLPASFTLTLGGAAGIMIGHNVGAARPDRARECLRLCLLLGVATATATMLLSVFIARPAVSLLTDDPAVVDQAVLALDRLRFALPAVAVMQGLLRAYTAVGKNKMASALSSAVTGAAIAIAYLHPGTGLEAVTAALVISLYAKAGLLATLYRGSFRSQLVPPA
jgi:Na+-driven multidrug efflux pump